MRATEGYEVRHISNTYFPELRQHWSCKHQDFLKQLKTLSSTKTQPGEAQWLQRLIHLPVQVFCKETSSYPGCLAFDPACCLWTEKAMGWWLKSLGLCPYVGDLEESPGPWLPISSAVAVATIWGRNQKAEDLHVSPSRCKFTFPIKIAKSWKRKETTHWCHHLISHLLTPSHFNSLRIFSQ